MTRLTGEREAPSADPGYIVLLALLLGAQPVATDVYLPALPALNAELGNPALTLTALMLAFGLAQIVWGPVSDRHGRKPVLVAGAVGYALAAFTAAMADSMEVLVACRIAQGVAMAALVVCARATVRDLYPPIDGMRVLSKGLSGLGFIALASPLVGAAVATVTPWRGSLVAIGVFGLLALAWVLIHFEESLSPEARRTARNAPRGALRLVLRGPKFRAWTALATASYCTLFGFLLGSSFVYMNVFGFSALGCGLVLALNCVAYIAGTYACRGLLARRAPVDAVRLAALFSVGGGVLVLATSLLWQPVPSVMMFGQCLFALGHGVHQPCSQAGAIGDYPEHAGRAASLSGAAMMMGAFITGQVLAPFLGTSAWPLVLSNAIGGTLIFMIAWTVVPRAYPEVKRA
ncbi:MAG: MFS transporter [Casimicrobiaceae bacterium]